MSPSPQRGVLPGVQMFRLGWAGCFPVGSSPYQLLPFNKLVLNQFTAGVAPARNSSGCGKLARRNSFGAACPGTRGACPQRPMEVADPGLPHPAQHPAGPKESPGTAEEQPMDWGGTGRLLSKEMMGDSSMEGPRSSWFRVFPHLFSLLSSRANLCQFPPLQRIEESKNSSFPESRPPLSFLLHLPGVKHGKKVSPRTVSSQYPGAVHGSGQLDSSGCPNPEGPGFQQIARFQLILLKHKLRHPSLGLE